MAEERLTYADEHAMRERDGETWPDRAAAIFDRRALLAELDALRADLARVTGERDEARLGIEQALGGGMERIAEQVEAAIVEAIGEVPDGSGCESGDEADVLAAEVRLAFNRITDERDDERAQANEWLAQAHDTRAQLAALHAAIGAARFEAQETLDGRQTILSACESLVVALGAIQAAHRDAAAAAKAFVEETAARAVAGVTEELGAMRSGYETVRADRDYHCDRAIALASALAEVREKATPLLDPRQVDGYALERAALRDALSALPADLAAQRDARVRAEALREAEALALGYGREVGDDHAWASNTADEIARLISERADEAERGGR